MAKHPARCHPGDSAHSRSQRGEVMQAGGPGVLGRLGRRGELEWGQATVSAGATRTHPARGLENEENVKRFSLGNTYGTFRTRPGDRHALSSGCFLGPRAGGQAPGWCPGAPSLADGRVPAVRQELLNGLSLGPDREREVFTRVQAGCWPGPAPICRR